MIDAERVLYKWAQARCPLFSISSKISFRISWRKEMWKLFGGRPRVWELTRPILSTRYVTGRSCSLRLSTFSITPRWVHDVERSCSAGVNHTVGRIYCFCQMLIEEPCFSAIASYLESLPSCVTFSICNWLSHVGLEDFSLGQHTLDVLLIVCCPSVSEPITQRFSYNF